MVRGEQVVPDGVEGGGGEGGMEGSEQEAAGVGYSKDGGGCYGSASDGGGEWEKKKASHRRKEGC